MYTGFCVDGLINTQLVQRTKYGGGGSICLHSKQLWVPFLIGLRALGAVGGGAFESDSSMAESLRVSEAVVAVGVKR